MRNDIIGILTDKKILVVDDEDQVIEFISTVLEENGYIPIIARDGEEAMDIIRQNRPDLVILDILMPKQSGIRMYRELKTSESLKDIPVIIYSGIARRTLKRALSARTVSTGERVPDPEAHIEKPVKPERIVFTVKKILS